MEDDILNFDIEGVGFVSVDISGPLTRDRVISIVEETLTKTLNEALPSKPRLNLAIGGFINGHISKGTPNQSTP